jgi:hypothetical protein
MKDLKAAEQTILACKMASSGMLHRVALVRTDILEELSASIIRVSRISELGALAITSSLILVTLMMEALSSSEMSVLTKATRRNIQTPFFIVTAVKT